MAELPYVVDNVTHPVSDDWAAVLKLTSQGTGTPVDLTGWEFYLIITKDLRWDDSDAYVFKTFQATEAASGEVTLSVLAEELSDPGGYQLGIKAKTASGTRATLVSGTFDLVSAGPKIV